MWLLTKAKPKCYMHTYNVVNLLVQQSYKLLYLLVLILLPFLPLEKLFLWQ